MQIHDIFVKRLIPAAQLIAGHLRMFRAALGYPHGKPRQDIENLNAMANDSLALVSAWLVSGLPHTQSKLDALDAALVQLLAQWKGEFLSTLAIVGLKPDACASYFLQDTPLATTSMRSRMTTLAKQESLRRLVNRQVTQMPRQLAQVLEHIGYSQEIRQIWLLTHVNHQHPLSADGRIGRWRSLARNSSFTQLRELLKVQPSKAWEQASTLTSKEGARRLPEYLEMLKAIPVSQDNATASSAMDDIQLLPRNYAIGRLPDGRIALTVKVGLTLETKWISEKGGVAAQFRKDELSDAEIAQFHNVQKSFEGTLLEGPQLLAAARSWEAQIQESLLATTARYVRYCEQLRRAQLRQKLETHFNADEQEMLRELLRS